MGSEYSGHSGHVLARSVGSDLVYKIHESDLDFTCVVSGSDQSIKLSVVDGSDGNVPPDFPQDIWKA